MIRLATLLFALLAASSARALAQCESQHLPVPVSGTYWSSFGSSVALEGDTLVVGDPWTNYTPHHAGAAYVYERQAGSWVQVQTLQYPDTIGGAKFGRSLALRGDTLMVGTPTFQGWVYCYERSGGSWSLVQTLTQASPLYHEFGGSIALDAAGQHAVIAANSSNEYGQDAKLYFYRKGAAGWSLTQVIEPEFKNTQNTIPFEWSLALEGNQLFVGNERDRTGSVSNQALGVVFEYAFQAGSGWSKVDELRLDPTQLHENFGAALARIDENRLAVGVTNYVPYGQMHSGAVLIFEHDGTGWNEVAALFDEHDPGSGDDFGSALAWQDPFLLIGAPGAGPGGELAGGAVYLFQEHGGTWRQAGMITPSVSPSYDYFGYGSALAVSGSEVAVGDPDSKASESQDSAWVLDLAAGGPTLYCESSPNSVGPGARISTFYSTSVSANEFVLLVSGAPPNVLGKFFYGPESQQLPFYNGVLCVGPGDKGVFRLLPPTPTSFTGSTSRFLDFSSPPAGSGPGQILPGSTWNFQFWYRDPLGGGTLASLSDAVRVTFCP